MSFKLFSRPLGFKGWVCFPNQGWQRGNSFEMPKRSYLKIKSLTWPTNTVCISTLKKTNEDCSKQQTSSLSWINVFIFFHIVYANCQAQRLPIANPAPYMHSCYSECEPLGPPLLIRNISILHSFSQALAIHVSTFLVPWLNYDSVLLYFRINLIFFSKALPTIHNYVIVSIINLSTCSYGPITRYMLLGWARL